ncbi:MAG: extracellular solute-binding protein, partial [Candidatus Velthaea sp.]
MKVVDHVIARPHFCASLAGAAAGALFGTRADGADNVFVLHAGSLTTAFQQRLAPEFEAKTHIHAEGEARGSVANGRLIGAALKNPDVWLSADVDVMRDLMREHPDALSWYATFGTTHITIAYARHSPHAAAFADAAAGRNAWYDVLHAPGVKLGRTDPAIDPKGYRAIIMAKLAERYYKRPGLERALFGDDRNPEQLLTDEAILVRLEQAEIDAAIVYGIEATIRSLPTIALPPEINLGDPRLRRMYASEAVTIEGTRRRGAPIEYA